MQILTTPYQGHVFGEQNYHFSYVFFISLVAALGGLLFGFDIAIIAGAIPFITIYFNLDDASLGWAVGSLHIGCMIGTLITGPLTDRFGRKLPLIAAALLFTVSAIGTGLVENYLWLIVNRILAGVAVGSASMLSPLYIAEICPANIRGRMVAFNQLTIVTGILLAYFTNYLLVDVENNWRWMFASAAVPSALFFVAMFIVPESPRWLVMKGQGDKAKKVLKKIGDDEYVNNEMSLMMSPIQNQKEGSIVDLIAPTFLPLFLFGLALAIFQQFSGVNNVFFYSVVIFEKAGMDKNAAIFQSVIIGLVNMVATMGSMYLVETLGRKKLMEWGALGMGISLIAVALCFQFDWLEGYWVIGFISLYVAIFAFTLGPVTWVLISEIFPNHVRGKAISIVTFFLWFACFLLSFTFPILISNFSPAITFGLFAAINLVYFFIIKRHLKETKGKSLEEIENIWRS